MRGTMMSARVFGPFPGWLSDGDPWGYGEDMERVREEAVRLGICADGNPCTEDAAP
jgi:hypothetical protein